MSSLTMPVQIVEVGMRDGFQSMPHFVPTEKKVELLRTLRDAGVTRVEATSFVSTKAVPQLADAAEVLAAAHEIPGLDPHVLVPTARQADRAFAAGARHIAFVLSASEWHNRNNVRRSPVESSEEFGQIVAVMPPGTRVRICIATSFDCPMQGRIEPDAVLTLLEQVIRHYPYMEIALCDTTGRANPPQVTTLFNLARRTFPHITHWAFHGHDTYGLGAANSLAAVQAGASAIDGAFAGVGGCPFAPGATGNVATEDLVWMFEQIGIRTGIKLNALLQVAEYASSLPGALSGGRVRVALSARAKLQSCQGGGS